MRALLPIALAALALAACSGPCDQLAARLCECPASGTTTDTCKKQATDALNKLSPTDSQCNGWLDTCQAPPDAQFCDFVNSRCGKALCGISVETPTEAGCALSR